MIPVHLKVKGFLSYRNLVEVDFTGFDLACISGHNGAGKSTLLDAMTWVLFGQARRRDDAIINNASEVAEIIFDFDYEKNHYRVQRTKPRNKTGMLEFFICSEDGNWRPLTEHSLRETEDRIQSILRMDYETFTNASFFLQGKADQFAQQRPADRKRILSTILGLEVWEKYREETVNRRRDTEKEINSLDGQLQEIENELDQEVSRRDRLKQLEQELNHLTEIRKTKEEALTNVRSMASALAEQGKTVRLLETQLGELRRKSTQREALLNERQTERDLYQQQVHNAPAIEKAFARWLEIRSQLEASDKIAGQYQQLQQRRAVHLSHIESEKARLQEELRSLQNRLAENELQSVRLPILKEQLNTLQQTTAIQQQKVEERNRLNNEYLLLSDQSAALSAENKRLSAEMNDLKEKMDSLQGTQEDECPLCGQPLGAEERSILLIKLEHQGKGLGDAYRSNQEVLADHQKKQFQCKSQIDALARVDSELQLMQLNISRTEAQIENIQQNQFNWEQNYSQRLKDLQDILSNSRFAQEARTQLADLDAAVSELKYDESEHFALRAAEQTARTSQEEMRLLEAARASLAPLEREISALQMNLEDDHQQIETQTQAYQQAATQHLAQQESLPDLNALESELYEIKTRENLQRMEVGGARQKVEILSTQRERQAALSQRRAELNLLISRYKTLEKAFGKDGVPALLIEQALPEIQEQANTILGKLSNDSMSVEFSTQRSYKDRQRDDKRETLDILINDSAGTREYEMFSGGEAFRVNFAIRLALSRVLARRAGARLQTLVIDEGFGSQDAEGRQRLIESINWVRADFSKILVITHLDELKDAFPARIEVEKNGNGSAVRVLVA